MKLSEKQLQPKLHKFISNPSIVYKSVSGKRLQILSPGKLNVKEGPDLLDIAILSDGMVYIGDAEFHLKSSDWSKHKHSDDSRYDNVILHIVCEDDKTQNGNFDTLVVPVDQLEKVEYSVEHEIDLQSIDVLQNFALLRLLRKATETKNLLKKMNIKDALSEYTRQFMERYNSRRRRPAYSKQDIGEIISGIANTILYDGLKEISLESKFTHEDLHVLNKNNIMSEGQALRTELLINIFLPLAIALSNDKTRIELFIWYWSAKSRNRYGNLIRRFPNIHQNYVWQQQGLLEYLKEYGERGDKVMKLSDYNFGDILDFYYCSSSEEIFDD
jgi:hypothetical protein